MRSRIVKAISVLSAFYQKKRDLLADALRDSRFELLPSEGSFFMLARFRGFSEESDSDFVLRLIRDARVATIPLSAFYTDGTDSGLIRLSFSKDDATLDRRRAPFVRNLIRAAADTALLRDCLRGIRTNPQCWPAAF